MIKKEIPDWNSYGNIVPIEGGQEMVRIVNGKVTPPAGAWGCNPVWWDSHMYCFPTSPRWWEFFCARHCVVIRKCRYMDLAPNYRYCGWPAPQPTDSDSDVYMSASDDSEDDTE